MLNLGNGLVKAGEIEAAKVMFANGKVCRQLRDLAVPRCFRGYSCLGSQCPRRVVRRRKP